MANAIHTRPNHHHVEANQGTNHEKPKPNASSDVKKERRYSLSKNSKTDDVISELKHMKWKMERQKGTSHQNWLTPEGQDHVTISVGGAAHRYVSPGLRHDIEKLVNKVLDRE